MNKEQDLRAYYTFGLTLLQLMSLLAFTGIALEVIVQYLF